MTIAWPFELRRLLSLRRTYSNSDHRPDWNGFTCTCDLSTVNLAVGREAFWELAETSLHEVQHLVQMRRGEPNPSNARCEREAKSEAAHLVAELRRDPRRTDDLIGLGATS